MTRFSWRPKECRAKCCQDTLTSIRKPSAADAHPDLKAYVISSSAGRRHGEIELVDWIGWISSLPADTEAGPLKQLEKSRR